MANKKSCRLEDKALLKAMIKGKSMGRASKKMQRKFEEFLKNLTHD